MNRIIITILTLSLATNLYAQSSIGLYPILSNDVTDLPFKPRLDNKVITYKSSVTEKPISKNFNSYGVRGGLFTPVSNNWYAVMNASYKQFDYLSRIDFTANPLPINYEHHSYEKIKGQELDMIFGIGKAFSIDNDQFMVIPTLSAFGRLNKSDRKIDNTMEYMYSEESHMSAEIGLQLGIHLNCKLSERIGLSLITNQLMSVSTTETQSTISYDIYNTQKTNYNLAKNVRPQIGLLYYFNSKKIF